MAKILLRYLGKHQVKKIYEVEERIAGELLQTGEWDLVDKPKTNLKIIK